MTSDFHSPVADAVDALDDLMARVGVDGLTAALAHPVLMTVVTQHTAAVRESVDSAGHPVDPDGVDSAGRPVDLIGLVTYARSVVAAAERSGCPLPAPGEADLSCSDWLGAPWPLLRLLGVCALIEETTLPAAAAAAVGRASA
ncbi:hypothetical protein SAMN05444365_104399 [Micromonospora pattaloongensis]|uniref:Uncharacterized protein n=1 Tax=Micromonospora pattaloongensis TaxID=405436 RepID=A0A1H3P9U2_9ACTN|nr:DUF6401 family natural product biosynthesis protein [Micromonospora pattaloongensis]SDY97810.1 hypothetical protein SAMN05444365_104399 [Micromonospora pattaloongensis]